MNNHIPKILISRTISYVSHLSVTPPHLLQEISTTECTERFEDKKIWIYIAFIVEWWWWCCHAWTDWGKLQSKLASMVWWCGSRDHVSLSRVHAVCCSWHICLSKRLAVGSSANTGKLLYNPCIFFFFFKCLVINSKNMQDSHCLKEGTVHTLFKEKEIDFVQNV